jgi:hypothetical protein
LLRLLDWSYSPFVAAYFAAEGAAKDMIGSCTRGSDAFCVWALSDRALALPDLMTRKATSELDERNAKLIRITAPTASNANLRAQRGVFILVRPERVIAEKRVTRWDLTTAVEGLLHTEGPALKQYVLDAEQAPLLLRLLAQQYVSAASVYPGVPGVIEALREESLWDTRESTRPSPSSILSVASSA